MKTRLDLELAKRGLAPSRSQAESLIMLGRVFVDGKRVEKAGFFVKPDAKLVVKEGMRYVSRGALKLASVAPRLGLKFNGATVLDVGSSTGGFTDYALQHGAKKVYAVDVGTGQLEWKLRNDKRVVVMEKTDIRDAADQKMLGEIPDIVVIDVSFISLRQVLPAVAQLSSAKTQIAAMVKPQFEADYKTASMHKGVIKNDTIRRQILKNFETWVKNVFIVESKADSEITGVKGNRERFYLLKLPKR